VCVILCACMYIWASGCVCVCLRDYSIKIYVNVIVCVLLCACDCGCERGWVLGSVCDGVWFGTYACKFNKFLCVWN